MKETLGLALRPALHTPKQIIEYTKTVEEIGSISHVFIPDIPGGLESVEISAGALSCTKSIKIGSGVIRLLEHDGEILQRRLETLQLMSENRFIFGVGTGRPGQKPKETIQNMLSQLDHLRANFGKGSRDPDITFPETFVATLKQGIAQKSVGHAEGLLLNFCSPKYAQRLVDKVSKTSSATPKFACYLKIFYSERPSIANRLLVEEFAKYDSIETYHGMFVRDGIAEDIAKANRTLESGGRIPESLLGTSLVNPELDELKRHIEKFKEAGIDLPCVYPYFQTPENHEYKISVIKKIADSA